MALAVDQPEDPLLTVNQVARALQYHPHTVRQKIAKGELPAVKLGFVLRIRRSALEGFIARSALPVRTESGG